MEELYSKIFKPFMNARLNIEPFTFLVDYKTADGEDRHTVMAGVGGCTTLEAAQGAIKAVEERGNTVQSIIQILGDHSADEIMKNLHSAEWLDSVEWKLVYLTSDAIKKEG